MKKIVMIATMATTLLVSCNNEDSPLTKSANKELTFTVGGIVSKAGIVDGAAFSDIGTSVGIFAVNVVDEATENDYKPTVALPFSIAEFHPTLNVGGTAIDATKVWNCVSTNKISLSTQEAKLYAFYPYADATNVDRALKTLKVNVSTSQDFKASAQADYMFATKAATVSEGLVIVKNSIPTANLYFHHALAKITFKVVKSPTYGATSVGLLKSIVLSNDVVGSQFSKTKDDASSTINLETGVFANTEIAPTLTFADVVGATIKLANADDNINGKVTKDGTPDFYIQGLVVPTGVLPTATTSLDATNSMKITMNVDGNDISGYLPYSADAKKWEAGKNYIYTITVTGTKLIVSNTVNVALWADVPASTAEVN